VKRQSCSAELRSREAYQFDFSHHIVLLSGVTVTFGGFDSGVRALVLLKPAMRYTRVFLNSGDPLPCRRELLPLSAMGGLR
jgi:hypothetical protein